MQASPQPRRRLGKINLVSSVVFVSFQWFPVASLVASASEEKSFLNNSALYMIQLIVKLDPSQFWDHNISGQCSHSEAICSLTRT